VEELASNLSTYKDQLREVSSPPSLDPACPLGLSLRSCVGSAFLRRVIPSLVCWVCVSSARSCFASEDLGCLFAD
jgi:hypothetical protein